MSTEPNVHLYAGTLQQLQEEANRQGKPLDVVVNEIVQLGLKIDRKSRLQALMDRTHDRVTRAGLTPQSEESVVDLIHQDRQERPHER